MAKLKNSGLIKHGSYYAKTYEEVHKFNFTQRILQGGIVKAIATWYTLNTEYNTQKEQGFDGLRSRHKFLGEPYVTSKTRANGRT